MFWQRSFYYVLIWLCVGCSSVDTTNSILQHVDDSASLDEALAGLVEAGVTPGLTVTVVKDGRAVYTKSFGYSDAAQTTPVTKADGFNLWSVSKLFTQLALLDLVETGEIKLTDPICVYLDWFKARECQPDSPHRLSRTIATLMNHTAGIPDLGLKLYGETQFDGDQVPSQKKLAQRLLNANEIWAEPGLESRYSNSHYLLLAAIIEQVSNQRFSDVVRTRVLTPLGLANTHYRYADNSPVMTGSHPADLTSFFAFFYVDKQRAVRVKEQGRYWFNNVYNSSLGSTGLVSNAGDIATFMTAMLACLNSKDGPIATATCKRINSAATVTVTKSPARGVEGLQQKLGWFVHPTELGDSFAHGGSGMAYTAMLQLFPDQELGVFVVANDSYFDKAGGLAVTNAVSKINWK